MLESIKNKYSKGVRTGNWVEDEWEEDFPYPLVHRNEKHKYQSQKKALYEEFNGVLDSQSTNHLRRSTIFPISKEPLFQTTYSSTIAKADFKGM